MEELAPPSDTKAIASLVTGVLATVSWFGFFALSCLGLGFIVLPVTLILGVVATVTGRMAQTEAAEHGEPANMALGGMILGIVNSVGVLLFGLLMCAGVLLYGGLLVANTV